MPRRNGGGRPSNKQLNYLKALAQKTGQSCTLPKTSREASQEIARMKALQATPRSELYRERDFDRPAGYGTAVQAEEVSGYGASARWRGAGT